MNYIDIHGHINFPEYDADREEVIARAREAGVGIINVGTDLESSRRGVELAAAHEDMWAIVGVHPTDAGPSAAFDYEAFRELAKHPKVVAIGECGLDYFHAKPEDMAAQRELFKKHIELANEVGKPLMLHVRNGKAPKEPASRSAASSSPAQPKSAYAEAIEILKEHSKVKANFHFFAGTAEDMNAAFDNGCTVSFTGVLTFTSDYDALVKSAPIDRIMTETDCPFVAPKPHRGKRNEPSYVIEVVKALARIRGEEEGKVAEQMVRNAKSFFGI